jgi:hypothetical protein
MTGHNMQICFPCFTDYTEIANKLIKESKIGKPSGYEKNNIEHVNTMHEIEMTAINQVKERKSNE